MSDGKWMGPSQSMDDGHKSEAHLTIERVDHYLRKRIFAPWSDPGAEKNGPQSEARKEKIGIELERFVVRNKGGDEHPTWSGILHEGRLQHQGLLLEIAQERGWKVMSEELEGEGFVVIGFKLPGSGLITFEPGKQMEHSSLAHDNLARLSQEVNQVREWALKGLHYDDPHYRLIALGTYPFNTPQSFNPEVPHLLNAKKRYRVLCDHFSRLNPWGYRLMVQSASSQVCLDVGTSEGEVAERYIVANLLTPIVYGIFAFSPFLDGLLTDKSCVRARITRLFDPQRCGLNKRLLSTLSSSSDLSDLSPVVSTYRDILLDAPFVYFDPERYEPLDGASLTLRDWMKEGRRVGKDGSVVEPLWQDVDWQLSMIFPEIRLKERFFELRGADAQAPCWELMIACFYLCLLLDEKVRGNLLELLIPYSDQMDELWSHAEYGLDHPLVAELSRKVMVLALQGAARRHPIFLGSDHELTKLRLFAERFTFAARTPADELRAAMAAQGTDVLNQDVWDGLMDQWQNYIAGGSGNL